MCLHAKAEKLYQDKGINSNHLYLVSTNIKKEPKQKTPDNWSSAGNWQSCPSAKNESLFILLQILKCFYDNFINIEI